MGFTLIRRKVPVTGGGGITLVESGGGSWNTSGTTVNFVETLAEDDVVVVGQGSDFTELMSVTGYTQIYQTDANPSMYVGWKRMGASPDSSFELISDGANDSGYVYYVFRGVDATTALDATSTVSASTNDPPSLTTVTDGAMRVIMVTMQDINVTAVTPPSGFTNEEFGAGGGAAGNTGSIVGATRLETTAGANDPGTFTPTPTDGGEGPAVHLALRPA